MARITTNSPTGEQLALDLYPTADPDTFAVWTLDTRGSSDVSAWLERRTKPGTKATRQWRPVWLEGTRTARTATWYPTREVALHELLCSLARAEDTPTEVLDRRDVSGLDLELTPGATHAGQFVHRAGELVGMVTRTGQTWLAETTSGTRRSRKLPSRRAALEYLAAQLPAPESEDEDPAARGLPEGFPAPSVLRAAIREAAAHDTEPEVLRSYSGATVPVLGTPITAAECTATTCPDHDPGPVPTELAVRDELRREMRDMARAVAYAQSEYHDLLDGRARMAYHADVAGFARNEVAGLLGVSRQMADRLVTRGYELVARDASPEPIRLPLSH